MYTYILVLIKLIVVKILCLIVNQIIINLNLYYYDYVTGQGKHEFMRIPSENINKDMGTFKKLLQRISFIKH